MKKHQNTNSKLFIPAEGGDKPTGCASKNVRCGSSHKRLVFIIYVLATALIVFLAVLLPKLFMQKTDDALMGTPVAYQANVGSLDMEYANIPVLRALYDREAAMNALTYNLSDIGSRGMTDEAYSDVMQRVYDSILSLADAGVITDDMANFIFAVIEKDGSPYIERYIDNVGFETIALFPSNNDYNAFQSYIGLEYDIGTDTLVNASFSLPPYTPPTQLETLPYLDNYVNYLGLPTQLDWQLSDDATQNTADDAAMEVRGVIWQQHTKASLVLRAQATYTLHYWAESTYLSFSITSYSTLTDEEFNSVTTYAGAPPPAYSESTPSASMVEQFGKYG